MTESAQRTAKPPVYAAFVGELNEISVKSLLGGICAALNTAPHLHLLIQSGGGAVGEGVFLFNFFRARADNVTLYNGGSISASAALAFLGAKERVASAHASFMIQRCRASLQGADVVPSESAADSLAIDDERVDGILKEYLTFPAEKWSRYDANSLWINARDAVTCGLATSIGEFSPPPGESVCAFG